MSDKIISGVSVARAGDLASALSASALWTQPVKNANALVVERIWRELARLAILAQYAESQLRSSQYVRTYAGTASVTYRQASHWLPGQDLDLGPIKVKGFNIVYVNTVETTSVATGGRLAIGSPVDAEIRLGTGELLTRMTGSAGVTYYGVLMALHSLADNTISMMDNVRSLLIRSQIGLPEDALTMQRLESLTSGSIQKVVAQWPMSSSAYGRFVISGKTLESGTALGIELSNAILRDLCPALYRAAREGLTVFQAAAEL